MSPERSTRHHPSAEIEHRTESGGGLLRPALTFALGNIVGWIAYVYSSLVVLNSLVQLDATVTVMPDISPIVTLWIAVAALSIIAFALLVRPATILAGWLMMGILVAIAATHFFGWTQTIVIVEGLTLGLVGVAGFVKLVSMLPAWGVVFLALDKRNRKR